MEPYATGISHSLSQRRSFDRTSSSGRASNGGSWRRSSIALSRDGSNRLLDDIPDEVIAQAGDSGDRVIDGSYTDPFDIIVDEVTEIGSRLNSFGRMSRRGSVSSSEKRGDHFDRDLENEMVARSGDSGDHVVGGDQHEGGDSRRIQLENNRGMGNEVRALPDDATLNSSYFHNRVADYSSPVSPLNPDVMYPHPTAPILSSNGINLNSSASQVRRSLSLKEYKLPRSLDYLSYLLHLAVFGILGVLTRYSLKKLFGPDFLALTSDQSPLYPDLLANVVGSFLMGWFGVVFKGDLRHISDHLAIGITTGYMGSLTTFSGWNQKMVELSAKGHWVFAVAGIIIGVWVVDRSTDMGVWTAGCLRRFFLHKLGRSIDDISITPDHWRVDRPTRHTVAMLTMLFILGCMWGMSGALTRTLLNDNTKEAELWLGCLVGPPGVWLRWYLARFNGQGLGRKGHFKWFPFGTLTANIIASCIMAALATVIKVVNSKRCEIIVSAVQLGFLGCLSTVSTCAVEVYAMRHSEHDGRALAYVATTFFLSFSLGTLLFSVPLWTKHYQ